MYLAYNSSDGDFIGSGKSVVLTDADGNFSVQIVRGEIHFTLDGGGDRWHLNLAPPQGVKLLAGTYGGAQRCAFHSPTRPGLEFYGGGRGCNRLSGSFNINRVIYDDLGASVLYLDVTFKQQCEETGQSLFGRLHYDARF